MTTTFDRGVPSAPVGDTCDGVQEFKSHSFRQRGLFPLLCDGRMERIRGGLSRGCHLRAGRRRGLRVRVSEMARALNSLCGVEGFPPAQHASPAQDEARHVLHRAAEAFTRRKPVGRFCVLPPCMAMAAALHPTVLISMRYHNPACGLHLCKISCDAKTPNILVGFKEKIL